MLRRKSIMIFLISSCFANSPNEKKYLFDQSRQNSQERHLKDLGFFLNDPTLTESHIRKAEREKEVEEKYLKENKPRSLMEKKDLNTNFEAKSVDHQQWGQLEGSSKESKTFLKGPWRSLENFFKSDNKFNESFPKED